MANSYHHDPADPQFRDRLFTEVAALPIDSPAGVSRELVLDLISVCNRLAERASTLERQLAQAQADHR